MDDSLRNMELCRIILVPGQRQPTPLDERVLAEVIDALSWHPYVSLDLRDAASVLLWLCRADPALGESIRRLARDALVLAEGDRISAGRAAVAAQILQNLLEGTSPEALQAISPGWEITLLAQSWLEREIGDPDRLREIIAGIGK